MLFDIRSQISLAGSATDQLCCKLFSPKFKEAMQRTRKAFEPGMRSLAALPGRGGAERASAAAATAAGAGVGTVGSLSAQLELPETTKLLILAGERLSTLRGSRP